MRDVINKVHPLIVALSTKYPAALPNGTSVQATILRGSRFMTELLKCAQSAEQALGVLAERDFPRYIWVVRATKEQKPILDFVCDPTESRLGSFIYGLILYGERWRPHEAEILNTPELASFPVWACV